MAELAIILPTYNEATNIAPMVATLEKTLAGIDWQAIVCDDQSPDGTADLAETIARRQPRLKVVRCPPPRDFARACRAGFEAADAPFLALMDADFQHDESLLPAMFRALRDEGLDLAIPTRYSGSGAAGSGFVPWRHFVSATLTRLGALMLKQKVSDPLGGYFMMARPVLVEARPHLIGGSIKILLDILCSVDRPLRIREFPYRFRRRKSGVSKLGLEAGLDFFRFIWRKRRQHR